MQFCRRSYQVTCQHPGANSAKVTAAAKFGQSTPKTAQESSGESAGWLASQLDAIFRQLKTFRTNVASPMFMAGV